MSAPLRFLGFAIVAYVGLRTASSALALEPILPLRSEPASASSTPQDALFAAAPAEAPLAQPASPDIYPRYMVPAALPQPYAFMPYPVMPAMMPAPRMSLPYLPQPPAPPPAGTPDLLPAGYAGSEAPPLDRWPAIGTAGPFSVGGLQETPSWNDGRGAKGDLPLLRSGRWSVDAWALARQPRSGMLGIDDPDEGLNPGLASAGSLGGSQAGLRLSWRPLPRVGVHLRASTALMPGGRNRQTMSGGEGALGVSWQPLGGLPVRLLAERRQRLGAPLGGGRNAFALLAEGGVSERELAHGILLDGYGQAGMVGARSRDLFADGALAATYPFMPRFAFGGGVWGGVQPGLHRLDAGPRLSYQLHPRMRLHLDYRFRMIGNADPPSGPALTIAGGF
jgi:hypothetical protein